MPEPTYFVPLLQAIPFLPTNLISSPDGDSLLDRIGLTDFNIVEAIDATTVELTLAFADELVAALPGLDGFELALGAEGSNELDVEVDVYPEFAVRIVNTTVRFRLAQDFLHPVHQDSTNEWVKDTDASGEPLPFEIRMEGLQFSLNTEDAVGFDLA
jgi:hypothetical protein